jgi:hypothetical protein
MTFPFRDEQRNRHKETLALIQRDPYSETYGEVIAHRHHLSDSLENQSASFRSKVWVKSLAD